MKRDYIREHLGELIEELLVKAKHDGDDYLAEARIVLQSDGVVTVRIPKTFSTEYYTIRVTHNA